MNRLQARLSHSRWHVVKFPMRYQGDAPQCQLLARIIQPEDHTIPIGDLIRHAAEIMSPDADRLIADYPRRAGRRTAQHDRHPAGHRRVAGHPA